ncbi:MAG: NAD-dependent epimerase/dehydratase family protein [Epsilonproteobacteria bacterium]|nr:NAD-dependent epimerase/dehydratase family protein [Campylobacterota bacterium]
MKQKSIVVTGAAGFVGANLVRYLNEQMYENIVLVDTLSKENYYKNLIGLKYCDFLNFEKGVEFLNDSIRQYENIAAIFHIGANADVLIEDCNIMMEMNFEHSKFWFNIAKEKNIPFIYASSSAVYGNGQSFRVIHEDENPHNEYAFSKLAFDNYVRSQINTCRNKVIGFRFFNIFGMGEFHKGKNASLPHRFFEFITTKGFIDLFSKEINRDYVWVEDVCRILYNTWQLNIQSGIYNLGSGNPISHEKLASLVIDVMSEENLINKEKDECIAKITMPQNLVNKFQYLTKAEDLLDWINDITKGNEDKIKLYIRALCQRYRNENTK